MLSLKKIWNKWHILIKILPFLAGIIILKFIAHSYSLEMISLNALFTSIVAATTFLIGFLITGVISDYKESEKIPGELAASMEAIYDEAQIMQKNKQSAEAQEFIEFHRSFLKSLLDWFYKRERTRAILGKISMMNGHFAKLEAQALPAFISRMKQEQNSIRKMVIRINTIRDTSFIQSAYAIVEILAFFLITGMVLLKMEPFYESIFFVCIVSSLVLYMLFLIKDLDNPFDYAAYGETGSEISIKPLNDLMERLYPTGSEK